MKNQRGFTLVELLVVIAIVGILIGIGVVAFHSIQNTARRRADEATVRVLNSATMMLAVSEAKSLETVFQEPSSSPDKLEDLVDRNALESVPTPAQPGVAFVWNTDALRWFVGFLVHVITTADGISINNNTIGRLGFISGGDPNNDTYSGAATDILIPRMFDGRVVAEIWQRVFRNTGLTSVSFADDSEVLQIHNQAFANNGLTELHLPSSLLKIDGGAFRDNKLTLVQFPPTVTEIEQRAFKNNNLTEVTLHAGMKIGLRAFADNAITKVSIGSNVEIADFVFNNSPIKQIAIGIAVTISASNPFGDFGATFKALYDSEDGGAGTYTWNGSAWVKQP